MSYVLIIIIYGEEKKHFSDRNKIDLVMWSCVSVYEFNQQITFQCQIEEKENCNISAHERMKVWNLKKKITKQIRK